MTKKVKRVKLLKGEKFMYFILVLLLIAIPVVNVYSKALLSETSIKLEKMTSKIEKQESINESLNMQIDELVSLENIEQVASEFGLSYNNDNIKTIE
ncbi:MAG: hypothetical protein IJ574_02635 [Bacilli bacterium]|nr:hypothetical protein [Bacilli bacterium]